MADEVCRVLFEIGYLVDHPEVKALALRAGCRESSGGRVLFCTEQVAELHSRLLAQYPPGSAEPHLLHSPREMATWIGNITPKYYDYNSGETVGGSLEALREVVKFAHMEPRVTGITLPLSRQDVPPAIEQMASLLEMARLTDKPLGAIDVTVPDTVPYVAAMGEALGAYRPVRRRLQLHQSAAAPGISHRRHHAPPPAISQPSA